LQNTEINSKLSKVSPGSGLSSLDGVFPANHSKH